MSTELSTQVDDAQLIGFLDNLGLTSKLTQQEKNTYLGIAKAFGLNPFKREIHVSKYGDTMSVITGYEVYIKRAERSGMLDGWNVTTTGSVATGDLKAILTIFRKDRSHPFIWEALYEECVQKTNQGVVTKFWQKASMMTKKVAISQGFRLCFSDELGGMPYTSDEIETHEVGHVEIIEQPKQLKELKPGTAEWNKTIVALKENKTDFQQLKELRTISDENEKLLTAAVEEVA